MAPREIDHGGAVMYTVGGRTQAVQADSPTTFTLRVTVPQSHGNRWVLVGAEGAGSGSSLSVDLGGHDPVTVLAGRLSLFSLPGRGRLVVVVAELGEPRNGEVLRVQRYASH